MIGFAKSSEKRFDRQPCCPSILYEGMRFLIGHSEVNPAEEFLSFACVRTNVSSLGFTTQSLLEIADIRLGPLAFSRSFGIIAKNG